MNYFKTSNKISVKSNNCKFLDSRKNKLDDEHKNLNEFCFAYFFDDDFSSHILTDSKK